MGEKMVFAKLGNAMLVKWC